MVQAQQQAAAAQAQAQAQVSFVVVVVVLVLLMLPHQPDKCCPVDSAVPPTMLCTFFLLLYILSILRYRG